MLNTESIKNLEMKKLTFGNVYADVVHNTIPLVRNNGAFGYVLPLSYVATNRMKKTKRDSYRKLQYTICIKFCR